MNPARRTTTMIGPARERFPEARFPPGNSESLWIAPYWNQVSWMKQRKVQHPVSCKPCQEFLHQFQYYSWIYLPIFNQYWSMFVGRTNLLRPAYLCKNGIQWEKPGALKTLFRCSRALGLPVTKSIQLPYPLAHQILVITIKVIYSLWAEIKTFPDKYAL